MCAVVSLEVEAFAKGFDAAEDGSEAAIDALFMGIDKGLEACGSLDEDAGGVDGGARLECALDGGEYFSIWAQDEGSFEGVDAEGYFAEEFFKEVGALVELWGVEGIDDVHFVLGVVEDMAEVFGEAFSVLRQACGGFEGVDIAEGCGEEGWGDSGLIPKEFAQALCSCEGFAVEGELGLEGGGVYAFGASGGVEPGDGAEVFMFVDEFIEHVFDEALGDGQGAGVAEGGDEFGVSSLGDGGFGRCAEDVLTKFGVDGGGDGGVEGVDGVFKG